MDDLNELERQRRLKLERIRGRGIDPYPPRANRTHTTAQARALLEADPVPASPPQAVIAGRLVAVRVMGKASFAHVEDGEGRLQVYARQDDLGAEAYELFRHDLDLGDYVEMGGFMFRTKTGEVTLHAQSLRLLSKALRPPPEKWHGLKDQEQRYRQRYLDLLSNDESRRVFVLRSRIVSAIRRYLDGQGFLEVETPTLQPLYGGATARPFTTHHNTLDTDLYLRISDELYLKRLIVGGFERVYEIGKDFRNEGIDTTHVPEFTMMECYAAYWDYHAVMSLVENMISTVAQEVLGSQQVTYREHTVSLTPPWKRITMRDAILNETDLDIMQTADLPALSTEIKRLGLKVEPARTWGKQVEELFGAYVEPKLVQPTFITEYPVDISPLAKKKPGESRIVERFEAFVATMECGNAFSELNDPQDQRDRFVELGKAAAQGDEETHPVDEDYILAMEYGMPPTGGLGIGIDRLTMLLLNQTAIREVILFPSLRQRDG
ncbi:MAG: lysine--tRNA ligase [Chloroflexi bacterium]|nr:lysine--tRNA ligase [Chloroflexota bacterium]